MVAAMSVGTTAGIVLLAPDPPALQVTVAEAAAALRGGTGRFKQVDTAPPNGDPAPLIQQLLADEVGVPAESVRAVWLDGARQQLESGPTVLKQRDPTSGTPPVLVLKPSEGGTFEMVPPAAISGPLRQLLLAQPQPAFAAGVRGDDGAWSSVIPRRTLVSDWRLRVVAALGLSLLLLAPLAWLFAHRLARPFRALAENLDVADAPLPVGGPRELRDAAAAIVRFRSRLVDEAKERARILTAVAHDLRTPLTSLKLWIDASPEPQRTRMAADADRMQAMIREVLDFTRAGEAPSERISVRPILAQIVDYMGGIGETLVLEEGPEVTITASESGFRRAVENLVRNAIDYAGGGRVWLGVDGNMVVVSVCDAGPGIASHDRERLLRPFERGDGSRNRSTGGAGLGLSIVGNFAQLHGGCVTLEDAPGGGLLASLKLPFTAPDGD